MILALFGGNGPTGQKVVEQALAAGHQVRALVRDPATLPAREGLTVVKGSPLNEADVDSVVQGSGAVLSVLGSRSLRATTIYSGSARNIIDAMRKHGVRRFVVTSSGGVEDDDPSMDFVYKRIIRPLFLQRAYDDCRRMEQHLREAQDLDWVCVRPTQLTDGERTSRYRVSPRFSPPTKARPEISRADVAEFMLNQLSDNQYVKGTPTLAY